MKKRPTAKKGSRKQFIHAQSKTERQMFGDSQSGGHDESLYYDQAANQFLSTEVSFGDSHSRQPDNQEALILNHCMLTRQ
jgi:hypothetical protein